MEEEGVESSMPLADDPLLDWIRRVNKAKCLPVSDLKALLADCTTRFQNDERYRNDERYLKLWMSYADLTDDPGKVFLLLQCRRIGTRLALFWAAWSYVVEMADDYSGAARLLAKGQARCALPTSLLEECRSAFDQRMDDRMRLAAALIRDGDANVKSSQVEPMSIEEHRELSHEQHMMEDDGLRVGCGPSGTECTGQSPSASDPCERIQHPQRKGVEACGTTEAEWSLQDTAVFDCPTSSQESSSPEPSSSECEEPGDQSLRMCDANSQVGALCEEDVVEGKGVQVCRRQSQHFNSGRGDDTPNAPVPDSPLSPGFTSDETRTVDGIVLVHAPFSKENRASMTTGRVEYQQWISTSRLIQDLRDESLGKKWPRKMMRRGPGAGHGGVMVRQLGSQRVNVSGILGEGAFAVVYACRLLGNGKEIAVKIERP
ncbi:unnamed protein product, partial [Choristocarpus tenellus]